MIFFLKNFCLSCLFILYFPLLFLIVQATTLYSGQSFGVADAGGDIVQHYPGKMKSTASMPGFTSPGIFNQIMIFNQTKALRISKSHPQ